MDNKNCLKKDLVNELYVIIKDIQGQIKASNSREDTQQITYLRTYLRGKKQGIATALEFINRYNGLDTAVRECESCQYNNEDEISKIAENNHQNFLKWKNAFDYACKEVGITEKQGLQLFNIISQKLEE